MSQINNFAPPLDRFLWGTASAAHQVEGHNYNSDWWQFEKEGRVKNGDTSEIACLHYEMYKEDFDLMRDLGHNAHRLSIEWSRIEPNEGEFDKEQINHYKNVISYLVSKGLTPVVTLHHFTSPLWFVRKGGFESSESSKVFARFVKTVVQALDESINIWITINEPLIYAYLGWVTGKFPPCKRNPLLAFKVIKNLTLSHMLAYEAIKTRFPGALVGIAHHMRAYRPAKPWYPLDIALSRTAHFLMNNWILDALQFGKLNPPIGHGQKIDGLKGSIDFLGINYYAKDYLHFKTLPVPRVENVVPNFEAKNKCDAGWIIYPQGFYEAIYTAHVRGLPILITENGVATEDDALRVSFIESHLSQMFEAIKQGCRVIGYLHWTFTDNFEWADGYSLKFGIVEIKKPSMERVPKQSAYFYKKQIQKYNELLLAMYCTRSKASQNTQQ